MSMIELTCQHCGATYLRTPSVIGRSRYCSRLCANTAIGQRQTEKALHTRTCPICNKKYQTTNHHGGKKTCSNQCAQIAKTQYERTARRSENTCTHCGKKFYTMPSRKRKYCNRQCVIAGWTNQHPRSKDTQCFYCAKPLIRSNSRITANSHQFCNNSCYHAWDADYKNTPDMKQKTAKRISDGLFSNPSKLEDRAAEWLTKNNILFDRQVQIRWYVVDFKIGDTYIEINGCYWHGCPTCYSEPTQKQAKRTNRDKSLLGYCRNRNIKLVVIWEHDLRKNGIDYLSSILSLRNN